MVRDPRRALTHAQRENSELGNMAGPHKFVAHLCKMCKRQHGWANGCCMETLHTWSGSMSEWMLRLASDGAARAYARAA